MYTPKIFFISEETWFEGQRKNWDNTCLKPRFKLYPTKITSVVETGLYLIVFTMWTRSDRP